MLYDSNALEWLFRTFNRMHYNLMKAEMVERGLSEASHPAILFTLKGDMKNMSATQKELSERIGISPATVAISVKRMEKAGLIRKVSDKSDLRRNYITLTDKGLRFISECEDAIKKIDLGTFRGFSEAETGQLKQFYLRMIHNLEDMGAQTPIPFRRSEAHDT
ncbi:hypothetical protein P22_0759 [Propionispora sp. 2/2-37]|uniref:MarR family winged helix-turn-helix transcriptional regulator n=1 Tax=Propionispora sp. 2/2-37 TaxID=1677858 RepID=UPI0006BB947E|nr:MarR family transcriptional regulator [Propionispora sp. 2/2-37]CUH94693.1 hypothetical protein P22_0759 [Propionispora sp. 2/2-37]